MADEPDEHAGPPADPAPGSREVGEPLSPERTWQSLAVGLAISIALVLLLVAVAVVISGGNGDDETATSTTTAPSPTVSGNPAPPTTAGQPSETGGPPTTRKPTPVPIVATDERRVVVLDQTGSAPPRTLFDLGPSTSSDQVPPSIGGVSLSGDLASAFFDVVGTPVEGAMKRVPLGGGAPQDIGQGVAPVPSADGSSLALIRAPEPDVPATVVVRSINGGSERRFDLGDGSCGNLTWAPSGREVAVDICSGGEPISVTIIDIASGGLRNLTAPDGTTWSIPAFKPDGTLTLVEQRQTDAAVVALTPDRNAVAATIIRRPSASINTIDWSAAGDLLLCDGDGIILAAVSGGRPEQVAAGFTAAAW